jgi:hypothetical protein
MSREGAEAQEEFSSFRPKREIILSLRVSRLCGRLFRLIGSRAAQLKKMWLNGLLKG